MGKKELPVKVVEPINCRTETAEVTYARSTLLLWQARYDWKYIERLRSETAAAVLSEGKKWEILETEPER